MKKLNLLIPVLFTFIFILIYIFMDLFVDFNDTDFVAENNTQNIDKYSTTYDTTTTEYYKALRLTKTDPIDLVDQNDNYSFKYEYIWDPYTGINSNIKDPNGPLYFDPLNLVYHFYCNRLRGLWVDPVDEESGYYEGYYGEFVGKGTDININSRGSYQEKYLFRLPIIDCYLPTNHNMAIVTMGPLLNDDDIKNLDKIVSSNKLNINNRKYRRMNLIPNLTTMKRYYDIALSIDPFNLNLTGLSAINTKIALKTADPKQTINRQAVNALRNM